MLFLSASSCHTAENTSYMFGATVASSVTFLVGIRGPLASYESVLLLAQIPFWTNREFSSVLIPSKRMNDTKGT